MSTLRPFFSLGVLFLLGEVITTIYSSKIPVSVLFNSTSQQFQVSNTYDDSYDAFGYYYTNYNESGWNYLTIDMQTEITHSEDFLAYSKSYGYLEGYITCQEIDNFYPNFYSSVFGNSSSLSPGNETIAFLNQNYEYLQAMSDQLSTTDDYWYTVKSILLQLEGLFQGFVDGCKKETTSFGTTAITSTTVSENANNNQWTSLDNPTLQHFLLLNAWGDLHQIMRKTTTTTEEEEENSSSGASSSQRGPINKLQKGSAFIKLFDNLSDILFAHTSWDSYETAFPRIIKQYNHPIMRNGFAEKHFSVHFSSSPGLLSSVDDFVLVNGYAQLAVMETTNTVYNKELSEKIIPETVLSWTRAVVAHQRSTSGADWAECFSRYSSGTNTNTWMILDLSLFQPGIGIADGFFTVLEEIPGLIQSADQTALLTTQSYFASYSIPFYPEIFNATGYRTLCERDDSLASFFCYETNPRGKIFSKYQKSVKDVSSGQWLIAYNSYQTEVLSEGDPCQSIACRADLQPINFDGKQEWSKEAYGAVDAKVSTVVNSKKKFGVRPVLFSRLGPTNDQQEKFCWEDIKKKKRSYVHKSHPECFDYEWVDFPPAN
jgi:hypothetical protein